MGQQLLVTPAKTAATTAASAAALRVQGVPAAGVDGDYDCCGSALCSAGPACDDGRVLRPVQVLYGVCEAGQTPGGGVEVSDDPQGWIEGHRGGFHVHVYFLHGVC